MSRIIAELAVQADTRELERVAKLFDEFSDAVKKGGKDGGIAYRNTLSSVDKLILKQAQLKKSLLNEKDTAKIQQYSKALNGVSMRLDSIAKKSANAKKSGIGDNGTAALLGGLGGGVSGAFGAIGGAIGGGVGGVIGQQLGQAADAMAQFGLESFKAAANYQSLIASVETFAGAQTPALIAEIEKFAIENPIANLEASVQSLSSLLAQGLSGEESIKVIKGLTEVTGGNVAQFERLTYQLAQVRTRGKLTGDNLKDLAQSGFAPLEFIAKRTGESLSQVQDRLSKGAVSYQEVLQALEDATTGTGRFAGRSAKIAKTAAGALAELDDSITTFKITLGGLIAESGATDLVRDFSAIVRATKDLISVFKELPAPLKEGFGVLTKEVARSIPILGSVVTTYDALSLAAKTYNESKNELGAFDINKAQKILTPFGTQFAQPLDLRNPAFNLDAQIQAQKDAIESSKRELSTLMQKSEDDEITGAERTRLRLLLQEKKKYSDLSEEQSKALKKMLKEDSAANEALLNENKKITEQLTKAYTDRQARIASLNDKLALSRFPVSETAQSIKDKYKIELDAELREIQANKDAIDKEIVVKNQAQSNLKIKLLESYEDEKKVITKYYFELENKEIEKHDKEIADIRANFDADLQKMARENQEGLLNTILATFNNEMEILRLRGIAEKEQINESYDAQKKAIEASGLLAEDKSDLITKLDFERNAALLNADRMQAEKRLEISDRYFETYLSDLEKFNNEQLLKQNNADKIARISLQDALNKGLISRKEYYKKLDQLEKEAILRQKQNRIAQIVGEVAVINEQQAPVTTKSGTRKQISDAESKALDERKKALLEELKSLGIDIDEIVVGMGTKAQDKQKEQLQAALDFSVQMVQIGADAMRNITDAQLASIDNLISVQQSRLDNARALAEAGFTDSLQKEQDRIEILQQKREAIIRRQIILDNIARISSQTLAVANTIAGASTPPTPATPFIIAASVASVLATIGASIAQARSFNTGTAWLTPQNSSQGRRTDDIPAYLNKGEGIIPTAPNERFNPITQAMIANDPKKIAFAAMQHPEIKKHLFNDYSFALSKANSAGNSTVKEIDRLNKVIDRMEQAIGGITIVNNNAQLNFDADGASKYMTKRQQRLADIRNKTK